MKIKSSRMKIENDKHSLIHLQSFWEQNVREYHI